MRGLFCLIFLLSFGCGEPATELLGLPIDTEPFNPISERAGIYPHNDVLDDPANFYRTHPPSEGAKWDIQSYGDPKLGFYAFASALTRVPSGENQFYVGVNLKRMYELDMVHPEKTAMVRQMTIDAFNTVIQSFPDDLTYDADGVTAHRVADYAQSELDSFVGP